ncbi:NAD(P)H-binding protein [Flammeovirga sp. OC4]|uniref:NmrA family NAD(P)-binding protein n=1 Tax=Flammeovirga sp. OC4 TaxID=1382345 RepID=UPI0005C67B14|nr:NAD(P)H-binding protein [Flammeovirga sp. OC4]
MEKIIVLGATGNIGQAVLEHLQNRDVEVYAGVRAEKDFDKVKGATPVIVDFTDQESLDHALAGKQRVFLVTPLMQHPEEVTKKVIQAAQKNNLKHIVRSTASGADSNGQIQMARWAGNSEDLIKASGLNYTILQPFNFVQNYINYYGQTIKEYNGFYIPNGDAELSLLDVTDLGEVAAIALTNEEHFGKTYALSGLKYSNEKVAEIISDVVGRKISYIDVPEDKAKESMLDNQMPDWLVEAMMELNYIIKQGWTAGYSADYKNITGKEYTSAKAYFEKNKNALK